MKCLIFVIEATSNLLNTSYAVVFEMFSVSAATVVFIVEDCISYLRIL